MDRVACITPCHSHPTHFLEACNSVMGQSHRFHTHVVVVDGPEVAETYKPLIAELEAEGWTGTALFLEEHAGVAAARNVAIRYLITELGYEDHDWYVNLDEDDRFYPHYLHELLDAVETFDEVSVWYSDWHWFGERHGYMLTYDWHPGQLFRAPYILATALTSIAVWQMVSSQNGTGYDPVLEEKGLRWEDYLYWLEAECCGFRMGRGGRGALIAVRVHEGRGTDVANATIPEWKAYAQEKLVRLYDTKHELLPERKEPSVS